MSTKPKVGRVRATYAFIKGNQREFGVEPMCRILNVATSGYYAWLKQPLSNRAQEDVRLLRLIRASFTASHGIYGATREKPAVSIASSGLCARTTCAPCTAIAPDAGPLASRPC